MLEHRAFESVEGEPAVEKGQDQRAGRAHAGGLGRRRQPAEDRSQRRGDQQRERHHADDDLARDGRRRMDPLLHRHRRAEPRVHEAPAKAVEDVERGEQEAGSERGGVELGDRHADHRAHDDQHDARRDQDAERAACGDRARRKLWVVAALDHDRRRHDAEHRHRRADDAGRHGEHRGGEDHDQEQSAPHRSQHVAESAEQALHEAGLLRHVAHEDEQRHGRQHLLLHQADDLEVGEVEHPRPEPHEAKDEGEEQKREGDRETDEDDAEEQDEHDQAEQLQPGHTTCVSGRSIGTPVRAAYRLFRSSATPWISKSIAVSGTTALNG